MMKDFFVDLKGLAFTDQAMPPEIKIEGETMPSEIKLEDVVDTKVDHPTHYTQNSMETIDVIENSMPRVHFCGYLRGNILKYMLRYEYKGGTEDLKKARWYLNRLIQTLT